MPEALRPDKMFYETTGCKLWQLGFTSEIAPSDSNIDFYIIGQTQMIANPYFMAKGYN